MHAEGPKYLIGNELVPSAMLQVQYRFWPTMLQVSSGTLKFRSSTLGKGKTMRLEQDCTIYSRPCSRDGRQTCFGSKYCQQVGKRHSHVFDRCEVRFEDLQAACAHVHAAEAGGANLGCSVCKDKCRCEHSEGTCECKKDGTASLNLERTSCCLTLWIPNLMMLNDIRGSIAGHVRFRLQRACLTC